MAPVLFAISVHAEGLQYTQGRIAMIEAAASQLEEKYPGDFELRKGMVTVPDFLRGLAKELRRDRWRELFGALAGAEGGLDGMGGDNPGVRR